MDYRLLFAMGEDTYFHPTGEQTATKIKGIWDTLTNKAKPTFEMVNVA